MKRIGLTGGAASGKTAVGEILKELGVQVLCADEIARDATGLTGSLIEQIREAFDPCFFDGSGALCRRPMRQHILANPAEKKKLEAIIHPYVRKKIDEWLGEPRGDYSMIIVPLLFETHMNAIFDKVITVECSREMQIKQLMARDKCTQEEAELLLANQLSPEDRIAMSDQVIHNDGDLKALEKQVLELHEQLKAA